MFKKNLPKNDQSGMTFIELVVVMGIFTAISATVLFNYRSFSDSVSLQNLSQEIALQGKRAQTLATQGRRPLLSAAQINNGLPSFLPPDWVSSYGIAFNLDHNNKSFIFYFNSPLFYEDEFNENESDFDILNRSRNLFFNDFVLGNFTAGCGAQESECLEEIFITDGSYIDLICLNSEPQLDPNCDQGDSARQLHIAYTRPRLEAYITAFGDNTPVSNYGPDIAYVAPYAFIRVSSRDGSSKRFVTFWSTGQIAVN